jgi:ATP/maltotriose-dependent transcriptional regulator MalT
MAERGRPMLSSEAHEVAGNVALLAGDLAEAVRSLQLAYDEKIAAGDRAGASTTETALAEAHLEAGDLDQAWKYATDARETASHDDIASQGRGREIQARVLSARGEDGGAEELARDAVAIMGRTDYLALHADALVHLAHVLHAAGKDPEALESARQAADLYDQKGATILVERTRGIIEGWTSRT